ncbi:MAG: sulfate transporter subunit, partial [Devosia sp.]
MKRTAQILALGGLVAAIGFAGVVTARADDQQLLNVSYDPTRELYQKYTDAFAHHWTALHPCSKDMLKVSIGGSGAQATPGIDGLGADV